eukprot:Awhi_evm1s1335
MQRFIKRINKAPTQCLRYELGGNPLSISPAHNQNESNNKNTGKIQVSYRDKRNNKNRNVEHYGGSCSICGKPRDFEVQILPNIYEYLLQDKSFSISDIDWITVLIYTCSRTRLCGKGNFVEEHIEIQVDPDATIISSSFGPKR